MTPPDALGALLGAGIAPSLPGPVAPATGADFLALVQDLLGRPGGELSTETPGKKAGSGEPATVPGDETVEDAPPEEEQAASLVVLPPALLQAVVAATTGEAPREQVTGTGSEPTATQPTGPTPSTASTAPSPDRPAPSSEATPAASAAPAPTTQLTPPTPSGQPISPAGVAPVAAAVPAPSTAAAPPPARVTHQVFPEVLRVAGLGDGPKRVTVRLQPENLGEVRVVLTSRRGELRVSLSASGGEAHRALVEGTPELRRLLDAVGSADARVVVRDLPVGTATPVSATTPTGTGSDVRGDLAGGTGNRQAAPQQQHGQDGRPGQSPTRGSSTAMDGTPDATNPLRRTESVTRARAGLDVTV